MNPWIKSNRSSDLLSWIWFSTPLIGFCVYSQADKLSFMFLTVFLEGKTWLLWSARCGTWPAAIIIMQEGHAFALWCCFPPTVPGTAWVSGNFMGTQGTVLPGKASLMSWVSCFTIFSTATSLSLSLGTCGVSSLQNTKKKKLGKCHKEKKGPLHREKAALPRPSCRLGLRQLLRGRPWAGDGNPTGPSSSPGSAINLLWVPGLVVQPLWASTSSSVK